MLLAESVRRTTTSLAHWLNSSVQEQVHGQFRCLGSPIELKERFCTETTPNCCQHSAKCICLPNAFNFASDYCKQALPPCMSLCPRLDSAPFWRPDMVQDTAFLSESQEGCWSTLNQVMGICHESQAQQFASHVWDLVVCLPWRRILNFIQVNNVYRSVSFNGQGLFQNWRQAVRSPFVFTHLHQFLLSNVGWIFLHYGSFMLIHAHLVIFGFSHECAVG